MQHVIIDVTAVHEVNILNRNYFKQTEKKMFGMYIMGAHSKVGTYLNSFDVKCPLKQKIKPKFSRKTFVVGVAR